MSTFLNRFNWDTDTRLIVVESLSAAAVYHDGLVYDVVDQALLVDYSTSPSYYMAGIGFTTTGAMCVFDASAGLPSDCRWQSGLPIKESGSRLCVDPTNAVSYYHQGVTFTTVGAVAVTGEAPPEETLIESITITVTNGGPETQNLSFTLIRFGNSGTISGPYTNQTTFLTEHPGVSTQDFSGITPPATGPVPVPALTGISSITQAVFQAAFGVYGVTAGSDGLDFIYTTFAQTSPVVITFNPPVNSVGVRVESESTGTYTATFTFSDATAPFVLANTSTYPPAFNSFSGYSTAGVSPTNNFYQQESNSDVYIQEVADSYIQE